MTHLTKSDRVLLYVIFGLMVALTTVLYYFDIAGISRLALYATIIFFFPTSWAWLAGHYEKKWLRLRDEQPAPRRQSSTHRGEAKYIHRGDSKSLAEALGVDI